MKKKLLFMCLVLRPLSCGLDLPSGNGNTKGITIHAVDAARIDAELPEAILNRYFGK